MLVFLVMYLFLQNMRATLIPTIAVPVVLLGTFAILAAFGYSINTLTMFGMVLAIGLLVDDAIVVVENVERVMMEDKLPPKEATEKSMSQIQGALVGIAMVLSAVFIPMAFFGGSTGAIYRQFSITIVSAMALSVLVALILTPALCATLLKPVSAEHHENKGGFFGWFNTTFDHSVNHYTNSVSKILGSTGCRLFHRCQHPYVQTGIPCSVLFRRFLRLCCLRQMASSQYASLCAEKLYVTDAIRTASVCTALEPHGRDIVLCGVAGLSGTSPPPSNSCYWTFSTDPAAEPPAAPLTAWRAGVCSACLLSSNNRTGR